MAVKPMGESLLALALIPRDDLALAAYARLGLAAFAVHLGLQIWRLKISDSALCLRLFKSNRHAGLMLFAGLLIEAVMRSA
jgi:4-hydroxybenzoate polyprenyltransferase